MRFVLMQGRAVVALTAWSVAISSTAALADTPAMKAERCATRLSIALLGTSPSAALLGAADPQSQVDAMLTSAPFIERFSRFINASFNDDPGMTTIQDSAYHLTRYILQNNRPWEELFIGPYKMEVDPANANQILVSNDPNGLGFFRSPAWLRRYAGNEEQGIKLSTAYRMLNNTLGITLVASTNAPDADVSATGRQAAGCRGCHFDSWYALDHVASVLSKRVGEGDAMTFEPYTGGPKSILGGHMISDDKELITTMVKSEHFKFRACRLAFQYLHGRNEQTCEAPTFDACMNEFSAKGTIQAALATVAKDANFCQ